MIRTFEDAEGCRWEVVLGRESWGVVLALFTPREGGEIRQVVLEATSREEGSRFLADLDRNGLEELFRKSEPR